MYKLHIKMLNAIVLFLLQVSCFCILANKTEDHSFRIDYERNCFMKDGKPFRYISGSLHYFRIPSYYWEDRLLKAKALGMNTIQTYIPWNIHEPKPGEYSFDGDKDLFRFISLVEKHGLLLILRPGPYIDAEWEFGGFPWWLAKNKSLVMRTSSPLYIEYVDRWFNVLLPKLTSNIYVNGGSIIAFQVENEYGNYYACDKAYLLQLKNIYDRIFGEDSVVLFTTDGYTDNYMKCGTSPSIFKTIDFGTEISPQDAFKQQRKYQPNGPLVNSEFYTGWLDYWGKWHQRRDAVEIAEHLENILAMNASVNLYMLHGGTNFGFMNGVDIDKNGERLISTTSYDYDAPISEAGDTTWKYFKIRDVIKRYVDHKLPNVPANTTKSGFGKFILSPFQIFQNFKDYLVFDAGFKPVQNAFPLRMADLDQGYGYVIYTPSIPEKYHYQSVTLEFEEGMRGQTIFIIDGRIDSIGFFKSVPFEVQLELGKTLDIMAINNGRAAYAPSGVHYLPETKGIFGKVRIKNTRESLNSWLMYNVNDTTILAGKDHADHENSTKTLLPKFGSSRPYQITYGADFSLYNPTDTFLRLNEFHQAQVYINQFNVGRSWNLEGPQQTLFVPKSVLRTGMNEILVINLDPWPQDAQPDDVFAEFLEEPILG